MSAAEQVEMAELRADAGIAFTDASVPLAAARAGQMLEVVGTARSG